MELIRFVKETILTVDHGVNDATGFGRDHWDATGHRLQCNQPKGFSSRGKDKGIGGAVGSDQIGPAQKTREDGRRVAVIFLQLLVAWPATDERHAYTRLGEDMFANLLQSLFR